MKKLAAVLLLALLLAAQSFAVPLGGKGTSRAQLVKGLFQVDGVLAVDGKTSFNGLWYTWPKKLGYNKTSVLKNNGAGILAWEKEQGAAGSDGQLQYNKGGEFSADAGLLWDQSKKALSVSGSVSSKSLLQNGVPVSVEGHKHSVSDLTEGVLGVDKGGTGSNDGSIAAAGELKLSSGGKNQNVVLSPSGTGSIVGEGGFLSKGEISASGSVRSEGNLEAKGKVLAGSGIAVNGQEGYTGSITYLTGMRFNGSVLQKKMATMTVTGGIITVVSKESDWIDVNAPKF